MPPLTRSVSHATHDLGFSSMIHFHKVHLSNGQTIDIPQREDGHFPCPVCGHIPKWMEKNNGKPVCCEPWYDPDNGLASADICPCCSFQPVCDDSTLDGTTVGTWALWRKQWLMRWVNVEKVWIETFEGYMRVSDAIKQLRNIGISIDEKYAESREVLIKAIEKM